MEKIIFAKFLANFFGDSMHDELVNMIEQRGWKTREAIDKNRRLIHVFVNDQLVFEYSFRLISDNDEFDIYIDEDIDWHEECGKWLLENWERITSEWNKDEYARKSTQKLMKVSKEIVAEIDNKVDLIACLV